MKKTKEYYRIEQLLRRYEKHIVRGEQTSTEYRTKIHRDERTKALKRIVYELLTEFPHELMPDKYEVLYWIDKTKIINLKKIWDGSNNVKERIVLSMLLYTLPPNSWFMYDLNVCRQYRLGISDYETIIKRLKEFKVIP
jgi:hypothetical protein